MQPRTTYRLRDRKLLNKDLRKPRPATLRLKILEQYEHIWRHAPSDNQLANINEVLSIVRGKFIRSPSQGAIEPTINSLIQDQLIEAKEVPNPQGEKEVLARITEKGRQELSDLHRHVKTQKIAAISALFAGVSAAAAIGSLLVGLSR